MREDQVRAKRGRLTQRQWVTLQGTLSRGFSVVNSKGKTLAIGAVPQGADGGFCLMKAKRYEHDAPLVQSVESLTGMAVRKYQ